MRDSIMHGIYTHVSTSVAATIDTTGVGTTCTTHRRWYQYCIMAVYYQRLHVMSSMLADEEEQVVNLLLDNQLMFRRQNKLLFTTLIFKKFSA